MENEMKERLISYIDQIENAAKELGPEVWEAAQLLVQVEGIVSLIAALVGTIFFGVLTKMLIDVGEKCHKEEPNGVAHAFPFTGAGISFCISIFMLANTLNWKYWLAALYPQAEILRRAMETIVPG